MAATYATDTAYERYFADATFLKEQGFTTNFAPVVDVASRTPNPLPGRMYSSDPEIVAEYAAEAITATMSAGITPVVKHFPGLGSATGNTDFTTSTIDPLEALEQRDLAPYRVLAHLQPDVMVGNMIVPNLTNGQPAVWSPAAIDLLRSLGYENAVVYSDSLTAAAISGTIEDAVVKAWTAGIDVAVVVQPSASTLDLGAYFAAIIDHGEVSVSQQLLDEAIINRSVLRIFERKQLEPCAVSAD
jgi:beta-N-acetylhexosaminidase